MRRLLRIALLVLVLISVAVLSALTAMRFAIHGGEVSVPNFVRMTPREAERAAQAQGLLLQIEGKFYSLDVPEGRIMSQVPSPGTKVRQGWRVQLAESLGPQRATIPSVVGESLRAAELNLRQRGLELGTVAVLSLAEVAPDEVAAQSPAANAQVASPKVSLLVGAAAEPPGLVMPNFVGHPLVEAAAAIEAGGLKLGKVNGPAQEEGTVQGTPQAPAPTPEAIAAPTVVVRQYPAAGQRVVPGTVVTLEVSR
ncbi:MAG TPA: PASTA domain-containing protein [Terriglobales bacterium]|nr:PASTA domain-containing protein [Terriglobales bacterium]